MNFAAPVLLWSCALALPVLWFARRSAAPLPSGQRWAVAALQTLAIVLAAIGLAGPWTQGAGPAHQVVVVGGEPWPGAAAELQAARAAVPAEAPFVVVRAGASPAFGLPGATVLPDAPGTPDLAAALRAVVASLPAGAAAEIALWTDGRHDGAPLAEAENELRLTGARLQLRQLPPPPRPALTLRGVEHAVRVAPGEAFRLVARIAAAAASSARLEVKVGEQLVGAADVALQAGEQFRTVEVLLQGRGVVAFDVELRGASGDPVAASERSAVLVEGDLRVLHLAGDASRREAVAATLRPHGITTVAPADPGEPLVAQAGFWDCRAVLVDDLPAAAWLGNHGLVRTAIAEGGLGLVLAGTHHNLGPGGYAESALAPLLPVRMPQREERRDPSVALVLIVDTSGSMGGGRLELAKEIARLAIQKLQPHDKVGLIEFHGSKRWAAPLQPATNTIEITRALNRLQVGGGTIIYAALEESYFALLNAQTRFQHVLVLTDGGVESGPFEALARRMAQAGQTLSTVLVGPTANSPFLQNLAQWGRGRFYACPDKFQLPDLMFREPQSALLPAVQERRVPLVRTGLAEATAAFAGDQLAPSGGIVEAAVREGAEVLLRGAAGEPYLVGWDQGARVLVLAGQALGPQSGELHDDPAYGAFLADLLRSAAAAAAGRDGQLRLRTQEAGFAVSFEDPAALAAEQPLVLRCGGRDWPLAPLGDRWQGFVDWPGATAERCEVRAGEVVLAAGAACPPSPRGGRTAPCDTDLQALAALRTTSPPAVAQVRAWGPLCGLLAVLAFLAGVLLRRWSWGRDPERRPPPAAGATPAAGAALASGGLMSWLVVAVLAGAARAQVPVPPAEPGAVQAAIDAELRRSGALDALAEAWREASPLHRLWLARARGDLAAAAAAAGSLGASAERAAILDVLGRPAEALVALGDLMPEGTAVERGAFLLRRAALRQAVGDTNGARTDLAAAVAAAPAMANQAAMLASGFGHLDLALQWTVVAQAPGRDAFQAALRRGQWQQRRGELAAAASEFELAVARAAMQRDRAFGLAMLVAARRAAGTLPALVDDWLARAGGRGEPLSQAEYGALGEAARELGRAGPALRALLAAPADVQREHQELMLSLSIEGGEPGAAEAQLRQRLQADRGDAEARASLALLLADQQRDAEAGQLLREGLAEASPRALRRLCAMASELGYDDVVTAVAAAFTAVATEAAEIDGPLLIVAHHRQQGRDAAAVQVLLGLREKVTRPADRLRLAEQLESLGRLREATDLYRDVYTATGTEDVGMRLAWLLGESKAAADREQAQAIYRRIWTEAGSAARRVQAEEHVLDLAAREGTLADLALELEAALGDPATRNRPAVRDALLKIYTRARDSTGAVSILQQWLKDEPARTVEALQALARVHLSAEEFRAHERALQRLIEVDPAGELDYRQQLAMSALERGRPLDAKAHIDGLLGKPGVPDTVALEFGAGIYTLAAMHEQAVRLYRRALALHPERVETFLLLGNALRAAGQRDAAIGTFQELLLRPLPDDLFVVAVDGLLNMEAPPVALRAAERAVRLRLAARPEQVFLHRVLQDLLEATQDERGRLQALEDTVVAAGEQRTNFVRELLQEAETKRDWGAYVRHGRTLLLLGDEVPPAVYLSLGEAMLHAGDADGASRAFSRARLAPDFAAVEARTAELYEGAGRLAEAERLRIRILRRAPNDVPALMAVGRLAERQGAMARALPNWLAAAQQLLPAALDHERPTGRRTMQGSFGPGGPDRSGPLFGEPFAGVLRCATSPDQLPALVAALQQASATGATPRRLNALKFLRQLVLAFPGHPLATGLRQAEDALLAGVDGEAARGELKKRRLQAGDLAGAAAIPAASPPTLDDLRLALLRADDAGRREVLDGLQQAAWPEAGRLLRLAGREADVRGLLAKATGDEAASVRAELHEVLGLPVPRELDRLQRELDSALQRNGVLVARVSAVGTALRAYPELPEGERRGHLAALAATVVEAKDVVAAERLLANHRADLEPAIAAELVAISFGKVERGYQLSTKARCLDLVDPQRALALLRSGLLKLKEEERRTAMMQLFANLDVPVEALVTMAGDFDLRNLSASDRVVFANGIGRRNVRPAVLRALAPRFALAAPGDALAELVAVAGIDDPEARRAAAVAALGRLLQRKAGDRDEVVFTLLANHLTKADAQALLEKAGPGPVSLLRTVLLVRAGAREAAAEAFLETYRQRPDDVALLYRAADFYDELGRPGEAARLYRTAKASASNWYPFQAMKLAQLELRAGDPRAALEALRATRDPSQMNFRLVLRCLAGIDDAELRRTALADALQQRAGRSDGAGGVLFLRSFLAAPEQPDALAAALAPVALPDVAPADLSAADRAPSDYDLLGFLPEGEAAATTLLCTLDEAQRAADLGVYRALLRAAGAAGLARQLGPALAVLAERPADAEAGRVIVAAAQLGQDVPAKALRGALEAMVVRRAESVPTLAAIASLAGRRGFVDLEERLLRYLCDQPTLLDDIELRPWLPGLLADVTRRYPEWIRGLLRPGIDDDFEAEVLAALVSGDPDPAQLTAMAWPPPDSAATALVSRDGNRLPARVGLALLRGELPAALGLLTKVDGTWPSVRGLAPHRLAAAVPVLTRWRDPALVEPFAAALLAALPNAEAAQGGLLARLLAILAARLDAAGRGAEASALRSRLAAATTELVWPAAAWGMP